MEMSERRTHTFQTIQNSEWTQDLNIIAEISIYKRNTQGKQVDMDLGKNFVGKSPKPQTIIEKWNYIKLKKLPRMRK